MKKTIQISRRSEDRLAEPYLWYDDRGDSPGWVLRYSLSDDLGQQHLDEPLDTDLPGDASEDELAAAAEAAAKYAGVPGYVVGGLPTDMDGDSAAFGA